VEWCGTVVSSNPIKGYYCFLEQESQPSLNSTGRCQESTQKWFTLVNHNQTLIK